MPTHVSRSGSENGQVGDKEQVEEEFERAGFMLFAEDALGQSTLGLSLRFKLSDRFGTDDVPLGLELLLADPFQGFRIDR